MKGWLRDFLLVSMLVAGPVAAADATTIWVDSVANTTSNPVVLSLGSGIYYVTPLLGSGWWTGLSWSNKYRLNSSEFSWYEVGTSGHGSKAEAFANAVGTSFTLTQPANVLFYFYDSKYNDNSGGMSLEVVPAPSTIWLLGAGLIGLAGLGGKRRKP
jgi:hypothetical protein